MAVIWQQWKVKEVMGKVYRLAERGVTAAESGRGKFHVGIEKSLD